MRWFVALIFMSISCLAATGWTHVESKRYGFAVDIPAGFAERAAESDNGDGVTFTSPDGTAELRVWGSELGDLSLRQDSSRRRKAEQADGWRISFSPIKRGWYVYSGTKDNRIVYLKAVSSCKGALALYFRIEYPRPEKLNYDAMVTRLSHSLRAGPAADCPET
jgi:hypothetical protein